MWLNRRPCQVLLSFFTLVLPACAIPNLEVKQSKGDELILIKRDTTLQDQSIHLNTTLLLGKKEFKFVNYFKNSLQDTAELFSINEYEGLSLTYEGITLQEFITLGEENCTSGFPPYFAVFNGDSIDNIEGFTPIQLRDARKEFILFFGYFFGCNGSFCNSGILLVVELSNNALRKAYTLGVDKSIVDLSQTSAKIVNGTFQLKLVAVKRGFSLSFQDSITLETDQYLQETGLFCINQ